MEQAHDLLTTYPENENINIVYIVSDGVETCDGDPVAAAKLLQADNIQAQVNIIGFDVDYRFFSDFITLPTIFQTQNFGDLGGSVLSLIKPFDILFFVDVFVIFYLRFSRKIQKETNHSGYKKAIAIIAFAIEDVIFQVQGGNYSFEADYRGSRICSSAVKKLR